MKFENHYRQNPNFPHRYISYQRLEKFLHENLSDYLSVIGTSYKGKNIYKISIGNGSTRVLAWSQMHGNESNGTHAMLDLLETLKDLPELKAQLLSEISLDFIFMLNPDGSEQWTRRNALDIDLNRDFLKRSSKELPFLISIAEQGNYDYALNLHEQRTIFSTDGEHPATLSFLAPSENVERDITENRQRCMAVISEIYESLKPYIPYQMARYTDEFYPASVGDNFMKMGIPTILYEGGHSVEDYKRVETRRYFTYALYYGLVAIAKLKGSLGRWQQYFDLPENKESHYDIIYRNVKLNTDFECILDIAVQYKEVYNEGNDDITLVPMVVEVGDCSRKKGWQEVDATGKFFKCERMYPKLDTPVDFEILSF